MRAKFNQSFKIQAVEKALSRSEETGLREIADSLGVALSTLHKWMKQSKAQELESVSNEGSFNPMTKEKRPQDWSQEEKLQIIIAAGSLDENAVSELCRKQGIYPHHLKQWKKDFAGSPQSNVPVKNNSEMKQLRQKIKGLERELNRKDKALAETAALLVLQKKVHEIWGNEEDSSL
jgi:transposase